MTSFQPTQAEQIIIESDMDEYKLNFRNTPISLIVQIRDKNGLEKNLKLVGTTIMSNGKVTLKIGDTITYIAIV